MQQAPELRRQKAWRTTLYWFVIEYHTPWPARTQAAYAAQDHSTRNLMVAQIGLWSKFLSQFYLTTADRGVW